MLRENFERRCIAWEQELVAGMRRDEPEAFMEFFRTFRPLLVEEARRLRVQPALRHEMVDDVEDGRYVALTVAGDSMTPLLHTGDTILVRLGPELGPDQVVVARHPEHGYVVKRVGRIDSMRVELTSLNTMYQPLSLPNDAALILGTVVLRWCPHASRD